MCTIKKSRMMKHFCIVFIVCFGIFRSGNTTILVDPLDTSFLLMQTRAYLAQICPSFVGCENGVRSMALDPCCTSCQCDSSCAQHHSCCPNSPYIQNTSIPFVSQQPGVVCRNTQYSGEPKNVYFSPEYEFVQTCFETTNETTKFYCENIEGKNKSGLVTDHIPVYDPESGVHYGNIHCAKCNMDDTSNVVPWQPKLSCTSKANLKMGLGGLDQVLKENECELEFVPPSFIPNVRPCFDDVITQCNMTGGWLEWNIDDVYFCHAPVDLLYLPIRRPLTKYKNIFCARCNGETDFDASFSYQCPATPFYDSSNDVITLLSYSVADLDPDHTGNIDRFEGTTKTRCPRNYLFDPITKDCMPLFCSPPLYLDVTTSTCRLFHQSVSKVRTCHSFYVNFNTIVTMLEAQIIVEEMRTRIVYSRKIKTCTIGIFYQTYKDYENNHSHDGITPNITIKGVYLTIYNNVMKLKAANPSLVYNESDSIIFDYLSFNHTNISVTVIGSDGFDPNMLHHEKTNNLVNLTYEAFADNKDGHPSHYVFVNPYDGTIILGHIENTLLYCSANIYKEDFMACSTFMYELTSSFTRVPDGITVNHSRENIHFSFDEFKSVSTSTVRICSQAVIDKISANISASTATGTGARLTLIAVFFLVALVFN